MATINNGNVQNTSTDYVVSNPEFVKNSTSKVLAQSNNSSMNNNIVGITPVKVGYFDGAGIWREGQRGAVISNSQESSFTNVPASKYATSISNVGARFSR